MSAAHQGTRVSLAPVLRPPSGWAVIPEGADSPAVLRRDALHKRLLALADILAAAVAVSMGVAVIGHDRIEPLALVALPLVVVVSKTIGLYDHDEHLLHKTTLEEAPALFQVATLYALVLWLSQGIVANGALGRDQVVGLWLLLFFSMMAARVGARLLATALSPPERVLVVGDPASAESVRQKMELTHAVKGEL